MHRIFDESLERRLFVGAAVHAKNGHPLRAAVYGVAGATISMLELVAECVSVPLFAVFGRLIACKRPMSRTEKDELIRELS